MKPNEIYFKTLAIMALVAFGPLFLTGAAAQSWEEPPTALVGRVSHIEGHLERLDPAADDWAVLVPDAPVGVDDQLYASPGSRVEILIPNDTLIRIGGEAQVRLVALTDHLTDIDVAAGTVRIYGKNDRTEIVATTPWGQVTAQPGSVFDLSVTDRAAQVRPLQGRIYFDKHLSGTRREIGAGAGALMVDDRGVQTVYGSVDRDWEDWNQAQEALWAGQRRASGQSVTYLPPPLHDEAYALDTHGTWQSVYYEGAYYRFWRPLHVGVGWTPFSVGTWMVWRGDRVWLPHEPFGYITHHYGNWIYTHGYWYWAPPVTRVMVQTGLPLLRIGFGWYPGRVSWISAGVQVGWIPLAPYEPYYSYYPWGRRTVVIARGTYPRPPTAYRYKHRDHVVMVHRDRVFRDRAARPRPALEPRRIPDRPNFRSAQPERNIRPSGPEADRPTRQDNRLTPIQEPRKPRVDVIRDPGRRSGQTGIRSEQRPKPIQPLEAIPVRPSQGSGEAVGRVRELRPPAVDRPVRTPLPNQPVQLQTDTRRQEPNPARPAPAEQRFQTRRQSPAPEVIQRQGGARMQPEQQRSPGLSGNGARLQSGGAPSGRPDLQQQRRSAPVVEPGRRTDVQNRSSNRNAIEANRNFR